MFGLMMLGYGTLIIKPRYQGIIYILKWAQITQAEAANKVYYFKMSLKLIYGSDHHILDMDQKMYVYIFSKEMKRFIF